ncbi:MAG: RNA-binding protein [Sarcina sp.]
MNKEYFLKKFDGKVDADILKLYNLYEKANSRGITLFSDEFYPPFVWKELEKISGKNIEISSSGIFLEADRRVISFNKREWEEYPTKLIQIKCNTKFQSLEHKDYLGSIMALGIRREKLGDLILVKDDICYLAAEENIALYVVENLHKIKKLNCECRILDFYEEVPSVSYKELSINISSNRLDAIVSELAKISRSKANELIDKGLILVDYAKVFSKTIEVEEDTRITIRGVGKFKVKETLGVTKNGRLKLTILKYT